MLEYYSKMERDAKKAEESSFPNVKIISKDYRINKLKILIAQLSELKRKRTLFLLLGERGTGKDLFARAIHEASGRKGKFIKIDCGDREETLFKSDLFGHVKGAFTGADRPRDGALQKAKDGTIFIDEIGNLSKSLQGSMLGFLQDWEFNPLGTIEKKPVEAIVVLATNKDLNVESKNGNFRPDLYDRISSFQAIIPPLRERRHDIIPLFLHLIDKHHNQIIEIHERDNMGAIDSYSKNFTMTPAFTKAIESFNWPGNVRELEGLAEKTASLRVVRNDSSPIDVHYYQEWFDSHFQSTDRVLPESNETSYPIKIKHGRIFEMDDSIFIELEKQGYSRKAIAQKYGVQPLAVTRRFNKIKNKINNK